MVEKIIVRLQKIINRLPGPGKMIFGALVVDRKAFGILLACIAAIFAVNLQPPVLSLYTPTIQEGLRDPGSGTPLYVSAAYLVLAVLTLVGGASGDLFGRKRFLLIGLVGALATNLLCMFWLNSTSYAIANTLNTMFIVLVAPMSVAIVTLAFPIQVRPFAYGAIFGSQAVALVLASSINGIMVALNAQWIGFIPAIAMCVVAIRLVRRDISESHAPAGTSRKELYLNVAWASAIFGLVFGIVAFGGGLDARNVFLVSAICILGFIVGYRWVVQRSHGSAVQLYNVRDLSLAIFAGIMLSVGQGTFFYQIGTFFQKIQGVGPIESGARMMPFILALMIATFLIVRLSMRFGARRLISGGTMVMAVGMSSMLFLKADTPYWQLILPLMVMGFGFGIATVARTVTVLTAPPPVFTGMAAGVNSAAGQSGFAIGAMISSLLVTVFANQQFIQTLKEQNVPKQVIDLASNAFENIFARVISGNLTRLPEELAAQLVVPFDDAFAAGLARTFLFVGILLGATAVIIFLGMHKGLKGSLIDKPLGQKTDPTTPAPEPPP